MIVVAIVGILAAVGLPAYQNYTSSAEMTACYNEAAAGKTRFTELIHAGNTPSGNNDWSTLGLRTSACNDGNITNGTSFWGQTDGLPVYATGLRFTFNYGNNVGWTCVVTQSGGDTAVTADDQANIGNLPLGCTWGA